MILSEDSQKSLDHIRFKVERQQYDLRGVELQCLAQVFEEIQFVMVKKKVKLNIGCPGCVKTAINVVYNFIHSHEERTNSNNAKVEVKRVDAPIEQPKLSELRLKYPHIKATSVEVFLQKLEDERRGN